MGNILLLDQDTDMALKIRLKYNQKLLLVLLLFCWSMLCCFLLFQYWREKEFKTENINSQLQLYNRFLLNKYDEHTTFKILLENKNLSFENIRVSVIDFSGNVLFDNFVDLTMLNNHANRSEIISALKNGSGYTIDRVSDSDGQKYFYSATKGKNIIIRTAIPYSDSLKELLEADMTFFWIMFAITLLMSCLGYFVTHRLGEHISRLNNFAKKAERGETVYNEESFPNDELGEISKHIISLYTNLQETILERDKEHQLAINQEQDKIRIKKQLTNNINHELKTPIASIQVCLETLLSVDLQEEKRNELILRCYQNCERLRHLLNDISLITRLEEGSQLIQKEAINLKDIISDIFSEFEITLKGKEIRINSHIEGNIEIEGNQSLIISIFQNLIDNSIAYSEAKNIYINIEDNNNLYSVTFEDDGIGVDEKHLPYLFERFYRVDKGRSRKMGGTGLGLSIVKHAVLFHGGEIKALKSEKGGLKFLFTLQKKELI